MQILIIEDNAALAANIAEYLETKGDQVDFAYTGSAGLELAANGTYDAVILDLALPRLDGLSLCRRLREEYHKDTAVLMLTARDTVVDKLGGFDAGTDDYLTKPFDLAELRARLLAIARRRGGADRGYSYGDLTFDPATMSAQRAGRRLKLSPTGLRLLEVLLRNAPALVRREELERAIWGEQPPQAETSLRVHVHALRAAVDGGFDTKLIHTVHGFGYRLGLDDAA